VLRDDGVLLFVGPGANHLRELREVLYENVTTHESETFDDAAANGFEQTQTETLELPLVLQQPEIMQLARMTPHYWRATAERRAHLEQLETLSVHAEFMLREWRKR
jgi:23S rRNA (guanine745-N1)-methyltransferase